MMESRIIITNMSERLLTIISEVCDSLDVTDNNERADIILRESANEGFYEVGCGTNRIVIANDNISDVVFKIALDDRGIADNNAEYILSDSLYPRGIVTCTYENNGVVSVSERVETMTSNDMDDYINDVNAILEELSHEYLLNDVGPKTFMNWGINSDSYAVILDYAYLTPIDQVKLNECVKCGGPIVYKKDLSGFECINCIRQYSFAEMAGTISMVAPDAGYVTNVPVDVNGDGELSEEEFNPHTETYVTSIPIDKNNDGVLSIDEFRK